MTAECQACRALRDELTRAMRRLEWYEKDPIKAERSLRGISRRDLVLALMRTNGRRDKAAQLLGVNVRTVFRRLRELGIDSAHEHDSSPGASPPVSKTG